MTISPMFASGSLGTEVLLYLLMLLTVPFLLAGLAIVSLVVNAKRGRPRLKGLFLAALLTVSGGAYLAALNNVGLGEIDRAICSGQACALR